jgi:polyphenol oxidase
MTDPSVLRSRVLDRAGFAHGFSTRIGGVSASPFASMNLGRSVGDDLGNVTENHARLARALGYSTEQLFEASQVHGNTVLVLRGDDHPTEIRQRKADALVARDAGAAVGVRTADCVPVLLADPTSGAVAAVHVGWRGIVNGIVFEAIQTLAGENPGQVVGSIGPAIGPCCFEVGDDVAAQIADAAGDGIVIRRGPQKPHVDLWRAVEHQLRRAGVSTLDTLGHCTMCDEQQFFSYRRDGARSGRMLAVIQAKERTESSR